MSASSRRTVIGIAAAVVVALVVAVVVVRAGVRHVPSYPNLADEPDVSITGTVAYLRGATPSPDGPPRACLVVRPAGGGPARELACDSNYLANSWRNDGTLQVLRTMSDRTQPSFSVTVYDPSTGAVVSSTTVASPTGFGPQRLEATRRDWASVRIESAHRLVLQFPDGAARTLLDGSGAPRDYQFVTAGFSPDGRWAMVVDSTGRALVVATEGPPRPRVLVPDLAVAYGPSVAWWQPAG